jgi:hypothetical protein
MNGRASVVAAFGLTAVALGSIAAILVRGADQVQRESGLSAIAAACVGALATFLNSRDKPLT